MRAQHRGAQPQRGQRRQLSADPRTEAVADRIGHDQLDSVKSVVGPEADILLPVWKGLELSEKGVAVWSGEDGHEATQVEARDASGSQSRRR